MWLLLATFALRRTSNCKGALTVFRSSRPPVEKIRNFSALERFRTRTPLRSHTFLHRCCSHLEQTSTNAAPTFCWEDLHVCAFGLLVRQRNSYFPPLGTSGIKEFADNANYDCEKLCIYWYWHPSLLRPLLRKKLTTLCFLRRSNHAVNHALGLIA